jgi:hypothetical protein
LTGDHQDRGYTYGREPPPDTGATPAGRSAAEPSDATLRTANRVSADYTIRFLSLLRNLGPGDLLDTLVSLALIQANVGHIDGVGPGAPDGLRADGAVPDNLRRPVSVLALADALGLPYETTRRRISHLADAGYCVRVAGGVMVPVATDGPGHDAVRRTNLSNLQRMFRALRLAGVCLD